MTELLEAALKFAAYGWPVFPCRPGGKLPATLHGVKDATTDPAVIRDWWTRMPAANVAIACGRPGPDVVDFDTKQGAPGAQSYAKLRDAGLLGGAFAVVSTPSGGWHLYYAGTDQGNSATRHGVDFRSHGGYVLAPPSLVDGKPYALIEHRKATGATVDWQAIRFTLAPPNMPPKMPKTFPRGHSDHGALVRWMGEQVEGNRNHALFWAACRAIEDGAGAWVLDDLAAAAIEAGLPTIEANRTVRSAQAKAGAR